MSVLINSTLYFSEDDAETVAFELLSDEFGDITFQKIIPTPNSEDLNPEWMFENWGCHGVPFLDGSETVDDFFTRGDIPRKLFAKLSEHPDIVEFGVLSYGEPQGLKQVEERYYAYKNGEEIKLTEKQFDKYINGDYEV